MKNPGKVLGVVVTIAVSAMCDGEAAATPFDGVSHQLERMVACDVSTFPANKRDEAATAKFVKDLKAAGVRAHHVGEPPEDQLIYALPRHITVFGQPVSKIDNFAPPFVMIEFNTSADELVSAITRSTGEAFGKTGPGSYELKNKKTISVAGQTYPFERNIYVSAEASGKSAYVCRYDDTDPKAGDA
ncbi:hypothetical protein ACFPTO_06020 [Paraburkholderia denitrificans]|uniref:Uncharacterized protein n=1 Tax=Paraburkholderia denitrificans TaxID=694025 RepID=A0ABW0J5Q0_9BURK